MTADINATIEVNELKLLTIIKLLYGLNVSVATLYYQFFTFELLICLIMTFLMSFGN